MARLSSYIVQCTAAQRGSSARLASIASCMLVYNCHLQPP
jgi:hypothetical protein